MVVRFDIVVHVVTRHMQKAGESESDAAFLKHVCSQLNCSHSYPSKPM